MRLTFNSATNKLRYLKHNLDLMTVDRVKLDLDVEV